MTGEIISIRNEILSSIEELRNLSVERPPSFTKYVEELKKFKNELENRHPEWMPEQIQMTLESSPTSFQKPRVKRSRNPIPPYARHEVFKRDGYRCLECGVTNKQRELHVDHIIPVSQGGSDELTNLQTLCVSCNLLKHNRMWIAGK